MNKMYDIAILGGGPAGVTAAIYCARKKLKTLMIAKEIGGQTAWSGGIENYPGFELITGPELAEKFESHLSKFEIDKKLREKIISLEKKENHFEIKTNKSVYEAKAVIIATGKRPKELGVPGEREFQGKGVAYCATCDAPFYADKEVAIIGAGNSGLDAGLQLMKIAKKIYIIEFLDKILGDIVMKDKIDASRKAQFFIGTSVKEIKGDEAVQSIVIEKDGKQKELSVQGIFITIGSVPNTEFAKGIKGIQLNKYNEIIVNDKCETGIEGLYAAGDITNIPYKQIISSAGQGCIAALSAYQHLSRK